MLQPVNQNNFTYYIDSSNTKRNVHQRIVADIATTDDVKSKIIEDIYGIFIRKPIKP